jgi:hypothetical protein
MNEFEQRYRRGLEQDICAAIDGRGWFFLLDGEDADGPDVVALIETSSSGALEPALADLLAWAGESTWVESLGLLFPRPWQRWEGGIAVHGLDLWTPLGRRTGPLFASTGNYLILASSESAIRTGQEIAGALPRETPPDRTRTAHASLRIDGAGLARLIGPWLDPALGLDGRWLYAVEPLLRHIEGIDVDVTHEPDAIRLRGCVRMSAQR